MLFYFLFMSLNVGLVYASENITDIFNRFKIQKSEDTINKMSRLLFFISLFCTILILTIRNINMSDDIAVYSNYFSSPWKGFAENSFYYFNVFVGFFTNNFHVFLLLVYCLSIGLFYYVVYKKEKNRYLYIFLFHALLIFGYNFSIIRQCVAMSVVFFDVYLYEKNIKTQSLKQATIIYYLILILAVLIHNSSIIFLVVPLFMKLMEYRYKYQILIGGTVCLFVVKNFLLNFIFTTLIPNKAAYLNEIGNISNLGIVPAFLFGFSAVVNFVLNKEDRNSIYANINLFVLYFTLFFYWFPSYGRFLQYGNYNMIFLLAPVLGNNKINKKMRLGIFFIILVIYMYLMMQNPYHIIPYYL